MGFVYRPFEFDPIAVEFGSRVVDEIVLASVDFHTEFGARCRPICLAWIGEGESESRDRKHHCHREDEGGGERSGPKSGLLLRGVRLLG